MPIDLRTGDTLAVVSLLSPFIATSRGLGTPPRAGADRATRNVPVVAVAQHAAVAPAKAAIEKPPEPEGIQTSATAVSKAR